MKFAFGLLIISMIFAQVLSTALAQIQKPPVAPAVTPASSPSPAPSPAASAAPVATPPTPSAQPLNLEESKPADILAGVIEDYNYSPEGKRDPFSPFEAENRIGTSMGPIFPLQKYELDQLKLAGVIWDVSQPKALIVDPMGRGHVVKLNEKLGRNNGYIARIREGEIIVIEGFKGTDGKVTYQTKVMKLD